MDDSKKISIKKHLEKHKAPEDIEIIFTDIAEQMEIYHNKNIIIGDFTENNIYIGENNILGFNYIIDSKDNIEKEKENDSCKYLILLMSAYLKKMDDKDIKDKLKADSNLTMDDVIYFYSSNKQNLPRFKQFRYIINKALRRVELNGDTNFNESNSISHGGLVKTNGHSLLPKDKPNGFVTLFVFPFVMIYLFLMIALLYWMIVLQ